MYFLSKININIFNCIVVGRHDVRNSGSFFLRHCLHPFSILILIQFLFLPQICPFFIFLKNASQTYKYSLGNKHTDIHLQKQVMFLNYLSWNILLASSGKGSTLWWPDSWMREKIIQLHMQVYAYLYVHLHTGHT